MIARRVRISGIVQGVGFRWFTRAQADARGVSGWVRNRRDGSVEAELHGSAEDVDSVLAALRVGPAHSTVNQVTTMPLPPATPAPTGFDIRESA